MSIYYVADLCGMKTGNYFFFLIPKVDSHSRSKQENILCSCNNEVNTALQVSIQGKLAQAVPLFHEDKMFSLHMVQINNPGGSRKSPDPSMPTALRQQ